MKKKQVVEQIIIGWREWVKLPEFLGNGHIKAKIDTGARTSALHAFNIEIFKHAKGRHKVKFALHPTQRNDQYTVQCEADLLDIRKIKNSGGNVENRYIIVTELCMGNKKWPIELTLTNRDTMGFRLLLGRTAINHNFLIDPNKSFLVKKYNK